MIIRLIKNAYLTNIAYIYITYINQIIKLRIFKIKCFFLKINLHNKSHLHNKFRNHSDKACHIIGSGYSLNDSKGKINNEDFVIGFNFAALANLDFDLFFFEFAGKKCADVSNKQKEALKYLIQNKKNNIYFKNALLPRNDLNFLYDHYGNDINIIEDIILQNRSTSTFDIIYNLMYNEKSNLFMQYNSSLFFCINVAKSIGFKTIIFHGVDFKGPYFFDNLKSDDFFENNHYEKRELNQNHSINKTSYGLEGYLSFLISKMENEVSFYCATNKTPLKKYLKNFYED